MSEYYVGLGQGGRRGGGGGGRRGGGGGGGGGRRGGGRPGGGGRHYGGGRRGWRGPSVAWSYPYPVHETVIVMDDPFVQACEAAGGAYARGVCWLPDGSTRTREQGLGASPLGLDVGFMNLNVAGAVGVAAFVAGWRVGGSMTKGLLWGAAGYIGANLIGLDTV